MERITEAAKAERSWHTDGGEPEVRRHREDLERLARVLGGTDTGRLRWCGASGTGVYKAVDLTRGLSACVAGPRRCPAYPFLGGFNEGVNDGRCAGHRRDVGQPRGHGRRRAAEFVRLLGRGVALSGRLRMGYGGSGPAQLALAVLLRFTDRDTARRYYRAFKWDCIATLPEADFRLRGEVVREWLAVHAGAGE